MRASRLRTAAALAGAALFASGCLHVHHGTPGRGHGPPPHAPAHGARAHHAGHELVWDAGLGVHVVVGLPGIYFSDGHYLRRGHGGWERAAGPDGPWRAASPAAVPPGLAKGAPPGHAGKTKPGRKF